MVVLLKLKDEKVFEYYDNYCKLYKLDYFSSDKSNTIVLRKVLNVGVNDNALGITLEKEFNFNTIFVEIGTIKEMEIKEREEKV